MQIGFVFIVERKGCYFMRRYEEIVDYCLEGCKERGLTWLENYRNECVGDERMFIDDLARIVNDVLGAKNSSERFYVSEEMRREILSRIGSIL